MTLVAPDNSAERKISRSRDVTDLCVIGHPSRLGGADTELDHQIRCWQEMGIQVHICHTGPLNDDLLALGLAERGCLYHEPCDWGSLDGLHCISFCNGGFLESLPEIRKYARTTSFVNCMTWNFEREVEMHRRGLIDFHLFQTSHGCERVGEKLSAAGPFRPLQFVPYFHAAEFPFYNSRPTDKFRFGRISRGDADKFGEQQLWIYETMTAPVLKEGLILGWDFRAQQRFGRSPDSYIRTVREGGVSQQDFYKFCEAIIMTTDTYENLPRVGFEAMASGSVLVVDNRGGWQLQVEHGVTGWLCHDDREFVYRASRCAFEVTEREDFRHQARRKLEREWGMQNSMDSWDQVFRQWANLR